MGLGGEAVKIIIIIAIGTFVTSAEVLLAYKFIFIPRLHTYFYLHNTHACTSEQEAYDPMYDMYITLQLFIQNNIIRHEHTIVMVYTELGTCGIFGNKKIESAYFFKSITL